MFQLEVLKCPFPLLNIALDISPKDTQEILQKNSDTTKSLEELLDPETFSRLRPFIRVDPINDYIVTNAKDLVVSNANREKARILITELKKYKALSLDILEKMTALVQERLSKNCDFKLFLGDLVIKKVLGFNEQSSLQEMRSEIENLRKILFQMYNPLFTYSQIQAKLENRDKKRDDFLAIHAQALKNENRMFLLKVFPCKVIKFWHGKVKLLCLDSIPAEMEFKHIDLGNKSNLYKGLEIKHYLKAG